EPTRLDAPARPHGAGQRQRIRAMRLEAIRRLLRRLAITVLDPQVPGLVSLVVHDIDVVPLEEVADLRLADLHRGEVGTPAVLGMIEADILDSRDRDGIDPTQRTEDL